MSEQPARWMTVREDEIKMYLSPQTVVRLYGHEPQKYLVDNFLTPAVLELQALQRIWYEMHPEVVASLQEHGYVFEDQLLVRTPRATPRAER